MIDMFVSGNAKTLHMECVSFQINGWPMNDSEDRICHGGFPRRIPRRDGLKAQ